MARDPRWCDEVMFWTNFGGSCLWASGGLGPLIRIAVAVENLSEILHNIPPCVHSSGEPAYPEGPSTYIVHTQAPK